MIRIIGKIPYSVTVACSGGVDSMVFTHFLRQSRRNITLAYFNHDTKHSQVAQLFVEKYANDNNLELITGGVKGLKGKRSLEEFWRDERYAFFNNLGNPFIITCHHLDDCIETWVMSSLHGTAKLIPYQRGEKIFRPFLLTEKSKIRDYALRHKLDWIEDPSNENVTHKRNYVRHVMMPHVLKINPGIKKVVRKKLIELYR